MKKIILSSLFLLAAACSSDDDGNGVSAPPTAMQGFWSSNQPKSSNSTVKDPNKPTTTCQGLEKTSTGVDTGLVRVDNNGMVYDAREVKSANQIYRHIGTLNANGDFVPTQAYQEELTGLTSNGSIQISLTGKASVVPDAFKGDQLVIDTTLTMVAPNFNQTQPWQQITFTRSNPLMEQQLISKAVDCANQP